MSFRRTLPWLAYLLVAIDLTALLFGELQPYRWVPATLACASAVFVLSAESRTVGVAACVLAIAFGTLGIADPKYIILLGFGALSMLCIAATQTVAPKLSRWMLVPIAFVEATGSSSLIRQTAFEFATVGHPTTAVDSCGVALSPFIFGVLLIFVFAGAGIATLLASVGRDSRAGITRPAAAATLRKNARTVALVLAIATGTVLGVTTWHDWQINEPCL